MLTKKSSKYLIWLTCEVCSNCSGFDIESSVAEEFGGQIGLGVDGKLHRAGAAAESRDDEEVGPRIGGEVGARNDWEVRSTAVGLMVFLAGGGEVLTRGGWEVVWPRARGGWEVGSTAGVGAVTKGGEEFVARAGGEVTSSGGGEASPSGGG